MATKVQRRRMILDLMIDQNPSNHSELQDWLSERGVHATQATLSRDLRDLGVVKGPGGYRLPEADGDANVRRDGSALRHALEQMLVRVDHGRNIVVLHTQPGNAGSLAYAIDHGDVPEMLGSVAGDDTILLVTSDTDQAGSLTERLRSLAGHC